MEICANTHYTIKFARILRFNWKTPQNIAISVRFIKNSKKKFSLKSWQTRVQITHEFFYWYQVQNQIRCHKNVIGTRLESSKTILGEKITTKFLQKLQKLFGSSVCHKRQPWLLCIACIYFYSYVGNRRGEKQYQDLSCINVRDLDYYILIQGRSEI